MSTGWDDGPMIMGDDWLDSPTPVSMIHVAAYPASNLCQMKHEDEKDRKRKELKLELNNLSVEIDMIKRFIALMEKRLIIIEKLCTSL